MIALTKLRVITEQLEPESTSAVVDWLPILAEITCNSL